LPSQSRTGYGKSTETADISIFTSSPYSVTTLIHEYSKEAWGRLEMQGVIIEVGEDGKAVGIRRIREQITAPANAAGQEIPIAEGGPGTGG
jgi:hypothetical protein